MDANAYPGRGLSLSQLVYALNEELKRVTYSPSFTLDAISQLDQDTATALTAIREWRNSLISINRIPLDVLSLIPTHLSSQGDRLRATFVCRHWRRTFVQHGTLWSQIFLQKGEAYAKTLLECAKGSTLDVLINQDVPAPVMALLLPHARRIKHLEFQNTLWEDIEKFSLTTSGSLPLLRTLKIAPGIGPNEVEQPVTISPLSPPFFGSALDLEEFTFDSTPFRFLNHFVFPRITAFHLMMNIVPASGASDLFEFLKASPQLQTVTIGTAYEIDPEHIPKNMVIVLPNVETFSLTSDGKNVYDVAVHISCPRAKNTSLTYLTTDLNMSPGREVFSTSVALNTIIHQYSRSPVEEATLEIKSIFSPCFLTFRSSDTSTIKLVFRLLAITEYEEDLTMTFSEIACEAFFQGIKAIRSHPQASHIKCLRIIYRDTAPVLHQLVVISAEVDKLFESVGPLDKLILDGDLRTYLAGITESVDLWEPIVFPPVKELTISHPLMEDREGHMSRIVKLVKSQHAKGMPFERVTVQARSLPVEMEERLRPWVGIVDCCEEVGEHVEF